MEDTNIDQLAAELNDHEITDDNGQINEVETTTEEISNPGITPLKAAQQAVSIARELSKSSAVAKSEARIVRSLQSDRGITGSNSINRQPDVDPDKMSDRELEAYLKKIGQW